MCYFEHKDSKQFFIFLFGKGYQTGEEGDYLLFLGEAFLPGQMLFVQRDTHLREKEINGQPSQTSFTFLDPTSRYGEQRKC